MVNLHHTELPPPDPPADVWGGRPPQQRQPAPQPRRRGQTVGATMGVVVAVGVLLVLLFCIVTFINGLRRNNAGIFANQEGEQNPPPGTVMPFLGQSTNGVWTYSLVSCFINNEGMLVSIQVDTNRSEDLARTINFEPRYFYLDDNSGIPYKCSQP